MKVKCIDLNDISMIDLFVESRNCAYKARSNERIPYQPLSREQLIHRITKNNGCIYGCFDKQQLIGGASCLRGAKGQSFFWKINNVWVCPEHQGKSVAKRLLCSIEEEAKNTDIQMLQLNVANIYEPAMNLYRKLGFRPVQIYANVPKTYYFIRLIKTISPYRYSEVKRWCHLLWSKLIFCLLYRCDSTPRKVHQIIYGKIKK